MIGAIIGDIVGSRFEFAKQTTPNFTLFDKDCNCTDETICNVAIADAILNYCCPIKLLSKFSCY